MPANQTKRHTDNAEPLNLIFLAVMHSKKSIFDETEFTVINVMTTQQAIDLAVVLGSYHEVPAYVTIGETLDESAEIFSNSALQKHDQTLAEATQHLKDEKKSQENK